MTKAPRIACRDCGKSRLAAIKITRRAANGEVYYVYKDQENGLMWCGGRCPKCTSAHRKIRDIIEKYQVVPALEFHVRKVQRKCFVDRIDSDCPIMESMRNLRE